MAEHLARVTCLPGDEILYSWRSFEAYPIIAATAGATSVRVPNTAGHEHDFELPDTYRYRDYVIRAFNDDVAYDQFVTEHIAGDLLLDEAGVRLVLIE